MKKIFLFAFITLFINNSFAQTTDTLKPENPFRHAEKLYEKFFPLGINLYYQKLYWDNTQNTSIFFEEEDRWTPALGVEYNFYQIGQFNFRAGFFVRNMQ